MDKSALRNLIKHKRDNIPLKLRKLKSKTIQANLLKDKLYQKAKTIFIYVNIKSEVETKEIIKQALKTKTVAVPHTNFKTKKMSAAKITELSQLKTIHFQLHEPRKVKTISKNKIDLVIMPGVAFDKQGNRLGYGSGFYDRYLEKTKIPKIALAFKAQIVKKIPSKKHDIKVDKIITE